MSPIPPYRCVRTILVQVVAATTIAAALATAPAGAHGTKTKNLEIVHPWCADSPEPGTRDVIVGMTIRNLAGRDDELVAARMPSGESGAVVAVPGTTGTTVVIPRGGAIDLHKAAAHVRVIGLKRPLVAYDTFPLTLVFKRAGAIKVDVMVEEVVR